MISLIHGDAFEELAKIPAESVDLVLADPPYGIKIATKKNGKELVNAWDCIDNYTEWSLLWIKEAKRVLKPNGVMYIWHNNFGMIADLQTAIKAQTGFALMSFCIWDKGDSYRAHTWINRDPDGATPLRTWFNTCEYCLHYFKTEKSTKMWNKTGLERIYSNPECFKSLKEWYKSELKRLGITEKDIAKKYTEVTGRKPNMLRHYFQDSQFELPTREVWERVYMPLGFGKEYEELRKEYEELRKEYEELRNYHRCDARHCNIWHLPAIPSQNRLHTCQKPVEILERLVNVSCRPGGVVLDPFAGSASTAIACIHAGRDFIGFEKDARYYNIAQKRIDNELERTALFRQDPSEELDHVEADLQQLHAAL